jgi:hypothetical protein
MAQIVLSEGAAPSTPSTGKVAIYAKTDGSCYFKGGDGVEFPFKSGREIWTALTGTTPSITAGSHTWTLTGASTPTDGLSDGDHCTLMIDDGSAATINWSSVVDQWDGGSAPELPTTGYLHVVLWKVGTTVYGSFGQGMAAP